MLLSKSLLALATSAMLGVSSAQDATAPEDSAVVKLDQTNFEDFIKENPLVMAEFFAPWCGHCKKLAPEYVKAAESLKADNIALAQIDCDDNRDLCRQLQVPGFPTIKLIKNGDLEKAKDYVGGRSADAIVSFMRKQTQPSVQVVDSKAKLDEIKANYSGAIVVDYGVKNLNSTFYKIADEKADEYLFVSFPSKEDKLAILLPAGDGKYEEMVFSGDKKDLVKEDSTVFSDWLKVESLPLFGEISGEVFNSYVDSGLPLAYYFFTEEGQVKEMEKTFIDLAKKYRGKMAFLKLDATKFGRHADNLSMKQQFPLFAIHNMTSNHKFGLPQLSEEDYAKLSKPQQLKAKDISKLVEEVIAGKAEPIIKSEAVPEKQENNVVKIVGKTHDKIVSDPKKDVLVKYYAPWCGHCKKMAPSYIELADALAADSSSKDKVVIAEVDATANDIFDIDISGYPTVYLYPAGKNTEPILYSGNRSPESFLEFLKENGANKYDGAAIYQKFIDEKANLAKDHSMKAPHTPLDHLPGSELTEQVGFEL
ncbi:Protein disulfide-isomerase [Nakaseomyces bracarensis]|uniref:Protein disulfide-isomerase n=1 Tax=Nakaseomyces bracarensis TaxID=273131 RepID=UPI0038727F33